MPYEKSTEEAAHDIDFGEISTLMSVIVQAGNHGQLYQKIASAAAARLKEIEQSFGEPLAADVEQQTRRTVMPAAGGDPIEVDENGNPVVPEQEPDEDPIDSEDENEDGVADDSPSADDIDPPPPNINRRI